MTEEPIKILVVDDHPLFRKGVVHMLQGESDMEIIGEATKHISQETRGKLSDVEWKKIAGLRDMLIHAYFGIDEDILWDVIQTKIPQLVEMVNIYMEDK